MESLDGTSWDVIIAGTGIQQSLLALALSRSDLKVLHLDRNDYYGGAEAALSLQEAEAWVERVNDDANPKKIFSEASIEVCQDDKGEVEQAASSKLSFSRAYSLALAPQVIYSRSELLQKLVSSKVYRQLEFLAVGSWYTAEHTPSRQLDGISDQSGTRISLRRIPSSREDVFADQSLDLNGRRRLMKFLRFIADYEQHEDTQEWQDPLSPLHTFPRFLERQFGIPRELQNPISALTLEPVSSSEVRTEVALRNVARHLRSIGVFGRGFGSVIPKWGGLSEVGQVACRAAAVGGATYVLDKSIASWRHVSESEIQVKLQGDENVTTKWLIGCDDNLAGTEGEQDTASRKGWQWCHTVSVIDSPLSTLFPPTAEGSPAPAGAVVYSPQSPTIGLNMVNDLPVYIHVHSHDTGECPSGQSVMYASIPLSAADIEDPDASPAHKRLDHAISDVLQNLQSSDDPQVLWRLRYTQWHRSPTSVSATKVKQNIYMLPAASLEVALDDAIIERVKSVWKDIIGQEADDHNFMVFEDREGVGGEEEDEDDG